MNPKKKPNARKLATRLIHHNLDAKPSHAGEERSFHPDVWDFEHHVVPPISASTTFRFDDTDHGAQSFQDFADPESVHAPSIYDRLGEPSKYLLEAHLADAEGGRMAVTFASGMGAVAGVLGALLHQGEHVVAHKRLYGCTDTLLHKWLKDHFGIQVDRVDLREPDQLESALRDETRVIYFETPVNPTMELIDIASISAAVARHNTRRAEKSRIYVVVDNTFATPYCQRPLEQGADFVVHSLTKGIGGFGTTMGGAVIGWTKGKNQAKEEKELLEMRRSLLLFRKDFGSVLAPQSAWNILTYGLPSLPPRMQWAQTSAKQIATWLHHHEAVDRVVYPGLAQAADYKLAKRQMCTPDGTFAPGILLYFELKGENETNQFWQAKALMDILAQPGHAITLAVSLGHARTLIEHPASMTHATLTAQEQKQRGIPQSGIRMSVGLEAPEDLICDLDGAFRMLKHAQLS